MERDSNSYPFLYGGCLEEASKLMGKGNFQRGQVVGLPGVGRMGNGGDVLPAAGGIHRSLRKVAG